MLSLSSVYSTGELNCNSSSGALFFFSKKSSLPIACFLCWTASHASKTKITASIGRRWIVFRLSGRLNANQNDLTVSLTVSLTVRVIIKSLTIFNILNAQAARFGKLRFARRPGDSHDWGRLINGLLAKNEKSEDLPNSCETCRQSDSPTIESPNGKLSNLTQFTE